MNKESARLSLQERLDNEKTIIDRRKLGQFSTPPELAEEIISFGIGLVSEKNIRFLDPAIGTGAFYSALLKKAGNSKIEYAKGIEIDKHYAMPAIELWADTQIKIEIGDYTSLTPNKEFNFIVCNPPYVRHHLIDNKKKVRDRTKQFSGVELSGLAGLYCHFLLQSIQWMEPGGISGWLIPSEFMDVNYGKNVKEFLLDKVDLLQIHRFDPSDVQFDDALVSSAVVWFRNSKPRDDGFIAFSYGGTLSSPSITKKISRRELRKELKWTRFPEKHVRELDRTTAVLGDYFAVKRGIATGNNNFFIMEKNKIEELGLPREFFRPVVPNSRYLDTDEILADDNGDPVLGTSWYLLDCQLPEYEIKSKYPTLWEYLLTGKDTVASGYLCRTRKCWYYQEKREAPLFLCTYMGRERQNSRQSFRFILNHSNATFTNCYLALYPRGNMKSLLTDRPEMKQSVWDVMNRIDPQFFIDEGRVYGGGLRKIEPAELLNVPVPEIESLMKKNNVTLTRPEKFVQMSMFG